MRVKPPKPILHKLRKFKSKLS